MTIFAMGFIFIMLFTACIGIGAVIFISVDTITQDTALDSMDDSLQLYDVVRQINTNTIETVNPQGIIQQWQRANEPHNNVA